MLTTVADETTEQLEKIQQEQVRQWSSRIKLWTLRPKCSPTVGLNCMRLVASVDLNKTCQRAAEFKCKERTKSEAAVYHKMGCLGLIMTDDATHASTCGVPDRERNEAKYLHEATEMLEEWQRKRSSSSHPTSQPSGIIFAPMAIQKTRGKGNVLCRLLFMLTVESCL